MFTVEEMSHHSSVFKKDGVTCFGNWFQIALLGAGGFGTVALWKHRFSNEQLAIKVFKDVKNKERSQQEIELMKRISHENVVKLVPIPDDWKKLSSRILCMEYCTEGSLRKLLNKPENCSGLKENIVRRCLKNVKDGLEYIHSQNIVHRDLKPENVVLQKMNDDILFKLIDFGYGVECDQNSQDKLGTLAGTSDYVAPEIFIASDGVFKKDGVTCFGNWFQIALLGAGGFGTVALWKHRFSNEQLAIKVFKDVKNKERSQQEIELMKRISHENVVKLVPIPDDWKKLSSRILCMEYCTEGSLRKLLNKPENCSGLKENIVRRCLKNVKDGLEYIHSQNIVHRDLKPENVVLQKMNDDILFKLIDFGYGVECDQNSQDKLGTLAGTSDYVAPEVFIASDGYTISVDYWGFGFICFEIITGHRPFLPHLKSTEWIAKIRHKTEEVICVYELPYKTNGDNIVFSADLPPENHITKSLASELKQWLRLALKMDYRKRGRNKQNELVIFSLMEEILNKKFISIFSSVDCALLSYLVDSSTTLLAIKENIFRDTGLSTKDQIILSPSGMTLGDDAKLIDFWNPSAEVAMLFVLTTVGVAFPFKEPNPPRSVITMAEQRKEPSAYHCRKKVYSDSIYFIQTQLNLCEAFYKTIYVELMSVCEFLHNLTALEENMRHNLFQCSAKIHLVQLSIQYNEKCYERACESKVVVECGDFLKEKKQKISSLKSELERKEKKLKDFSVQLQEVTKKLSETQAFNCGAHNMEELKQYLVSACCIYKNLQQLPKELRKCEGSCSDMVNIMYDFLATMHSVREEKTCHGTVEASKSSKATITSLFPVAQQLSIELKHLDDNVVRAELGLFKAIWGLKKLTSPIDDAGATNGGLPAPERTAEQTWNPVSSMSAAGSTTLDGTVHSAGGLILTNRSLHHQFEECLAQFKENFEEILKSYTKYDTQPPTN